MSFFCIIDCIPIQDVDTTELLREMRFDMSDTQAPQVKEEPMECFIHDCKLEKCTSQTGWEYVKCPMSDCFIFTGLNRVNDYLKNVQDQIPTWYKWNKDKLKCFCSHPIVLCQSRSEKNPDRIYFKCQRNRCNFFQWGDEVHSGKNMVWMNNTEHVGIPCVTPIPTKEHSGEDLLWDQVQAYTRFTTTGTVLRMRSVALQK